MGHLLAVVGMDSKETGRWLKNGITAITFLTGQAPSRPVWRGSTALTVVPPLHAPAVGIAEADCAVAGVGMPFFMSAYGQEAVRRLASCVDSGQTLEYCARKMDGINAVAVLHRTGELSIITDRLGSLHLFQAQAGTCKLLSTSTLVLGALLNSSFSRYGVRQFLNTGTVYEGSLFDGVEKLMAASIHTYSKEDTRYVRYWSPSDIEYSRGEHRVEQIGDALTETLVAISEVFPNPVLDLTGGFDSRILLAAMLESGRRFSTVVVGTSTDGDVRVAEYIAREFGLNHIHKVPIKREDEVWESALQSVRLYDGESDALLRAHIPAVHIELAKEFDCSVNGSNGELTKGHWWELLFPYTGSTKPLDAYLLAARRFAVSSEGDDLLDDSFQQSLAESFESLINHVNINIDHTPNTMQIDQIYLLLQMQRWQGRLASGIARIWPCFSPYMFEKPMSLILAIPPDQRVRHRLTRRLLYTLNPRLADIPLYNGTPAAPLSLRTAWGFRKIVFRQAHKVVMRTMGMHNQQTVYNFSNSFWQNREFKQTMEYSSMLTANLYRCERLSALVQADTMRRNSNPLLGRVFTLERLALDVREMQREVFKLHS